MKISDIIFALECVEAERGICNNAKESAIEILRMVDACDESSATKCFETINQIKRGGGF